jgi:hypothetical protein
MSRALCGYECASVYVDQNQRSEQWNSGDENAAGVKQTRELR